MTVARSRSLCCFVLHDAAWSLHVHAPTRLALHPVFLGIQALEFPELLARVRTLLRRRTAPVLTDQIQVADLTLDLPRHRATRAGRKINLSHKEFCLLELLARRQGEVLPRSLIASQVWDMNFDSDTNVIDVAIRRLRAKIDDDFEPKLIHTVRGMGYKLDVEDDYGER